MAKSGEQGAQPVFTEVCPTLALRASLYHLLDPFLWPVLCLDDSPPKAPGAAGFGGHMA